jgi:hypothetical protein
MNALLYPTFWAWQSVAQFLLKVVEPVLRICHQFKLGLRLGLKSVRLPYVVLEFGHALQRLFQGFLRILYQVGFMTCAQGEAYRHLAPCASRREPNKRLTTATARASGSRSTNQMGTLEPKRNFSRASPLGQLNRR